MTFVNKPLLVKNNKGLTKYRQRGASLPLVVAEKNNAQINIRAKKWILNVGGEPLKVE